MKIIQLTKQLSQILNDEILLGKIAIAFMNVLEISIATAQLNTRIHANSSYLHNYQIYPRV